MKLEEKILIDYASRAELIDNLGHRIGELEDTLEAMDNNIEEADHCGLGEVVEILCENRNKLNLTLLELKLQYNKLEKEQLEFERIQLLSK